MPSAPPEVDRLALPVHLLQIEPDRALADIEPALVELIRDVVADHRALVLLEDLENGETAPLEFAVHLLPCLGRL